ncbi:ABC transporter ATP-binding protein [bacterium]|nr:ABC transporter ATP-binding protein [bacterium]
MVADDTPKRAAIELRGVTKAFVVESQRVEALHDVSLRIERGSCVAVTGRSGAGKSTLLHIIGTLDRPSQGSVMIGGVDVSRLSDQVTSKFRNEKLGFVFQSSNLLPEFTALENVMMPGVISGVRGSGARKRAARLLDAVGLGARANHRPAELSGGEQQRVAIARALFMEPEVLLADEPTGNLDKNTSLAIQDLLIDLAARHNTTMILVTHDQQLAERMPSRIVMEDGRVLSGTGVAL